MFFILSELYLSGMFFNEKGMFAGSFVSRVQPAARSEPLRIVMIDFSPPGNRPCRLPAPLDPPRALGGGGEKPGSGPSLPPLAAAATIGSGPRERAPAS